MSNAIGFIKNVTVHPFAADWYVKIVESVCKKCDVPFNGKSKLYDLEDGDSE